MRDFEDDEGPDPEMGIWGWEYGKYLADSVRELTPLEKLKIKQYEELEERTREYFRRQKEMEDRASYEFNRYLIDTYNEARKNAK